VKRVDSTRGADSPVLAGVVTGRLVAVVGLAVLLVAPLSVGTGTAGASFPARALSTSGRTRSPAALSGPQVFGWGFDNPDAVATDGTDVWVTSHHSNVVIELNNSTGAVVQVDAGSTYGFDDPDAVATDGTDVWVTNDSGNSVTELSASTGDLVQVISGSTYGFDNPDAVATDGTDLWVTNQAGQSVTGFPVA
jgi:hypothetical protein